MQRAKIIFEQQGFSVIEAPTGFQSRHASQSLLLQLLPNARALQQSNRAIIELLYNQWYRIIY